jgi:hypothetical protein
MKTKLIPLLCFLYFFGSLNCTSKLPGDTKANLGLLSFFSKFKSSPAIPCRKYQKKANMNISSLNSTTSITTTKINSSTCNFDLNSKSLFCAYEYPIGFFGNIVNNERKFYTTVLDYIEEKNIPFKSRQISEIENEDIATKKDLSYSTDGKLIQIVEASGTVSTIDTYDSLGRPLTRKTKLTILSNPCYVPSLQTYDDAKKYGSYSILFSAANPCSIMFPTAADLKIEISYEADLFITKQILTTGVIVSTTNFTTVEVGEVCNNPTSTNP